MTRNQKIIFFGAIGVFLALIALIIVLIVKNAKANKAVENNNQELIDSLRQENLNGLANEFNLLNEQIDMYERSGITISNDTLLQQFNEAKERMRIISEELEREKRSNNVNREKIRQLEAEIVTLKGIAKHYLEEIRRLNNENDSLRTRLDAQTAINQTITQENESMRTSNARLTQTVQIAKKLNISGLSLQGYKKNNKQEKNIKKAAILGVTFNVLPNQTAEAGRKMFYVCIYSPEGYLLGSGPSFSYDGATVQSTQAKEEEYGNQGISVAIYWQVNTTLTPGTYKVEVFADGNKLGSGSFNMK